MAWGAVPLRRPATAAPTGGSVAVGTQTRAYREQQAQPAATAAHAPSAAAPTWTPPPTGSYDPTRDVNVEEGARGLGQLERELATAGTRDTSNFLLSQGEIQRRQGQEGEDYGHAQEALKRAFSSLAGTQESRANAYGVIDGGALLASAAKRASNQGLQEQTAATGHARRQEGFAQQLAQLALEGAPPDAANPVGGREFQDIQSKLTNAQANQVAFEQHEHELAGDEAGKNGWRPAEPAPAAAPVVTKPAARRSGASAAHAGAARFQRLSRRRGF